MTCSTARHPVAAIVSGALIAAAITSSAVAGPDFSLPNSLTPPAVPASGVYVGAWVNPLGLSSQDGANEVRQLPRFNSYVNAPVSILHVYTLFGDAFPSQTLAAVQANGSIPMVDWSCENVDQIAAGSWDSVITAFAQGFKAFGKPAFLRWYWEMNLNPPGHVACGGYHHGASYVAAWTHIWQIFQQVGASNVAFVWCPSSHGAAGQYYPGDAYVDWIAADGYDRAHLGATAFHQIYSAFYATWSIHPKPLMVGETAAPALYQYPYLMSMPTLLQYTYPKVKAFIYFDAPGDHANWSFGGNGVSAFRNLAASPYAFHPH